eukprot:gene49859-27946_t
MGADPTVVVAVTPWPCALSARAYDPAAGAWGAALPVSLPQTGRARGRGGDAGTRA